MNYLLLALGWLAYLTLHSLLASDAVKEKVEKKWPTLHNRYRFVYSVLSSIGLLLLIYLMATIPRELVFVSGKTIKYVAMVFASWGVILIIVSFRHLSGKAFLGLKKQVPSGLIRSGLHARIRHPIYSGTVLVLIGLLLYVPTYSVLLSDILIFLYLPVGTYLEEQKLIKEYGAAYLEYKREVPAFIPKIIS